MMARTELRGDGGPAMITFMLDAVAFQQRMESLLWIAPTLKQSTR